MTEKNRQNTKKPTERKIVMFKHEEKEGMVSLLITPHGPTYTSSVSQRTIRNYFKRSMKIANDRVWIRPQI